jgi:lipid A 3-O-deacylase
MKALVAATAVLLAGLATVPPARADLDDLAGIQLQWDNDRWGSRQTDRWYTNGIRATWTFADDQPRRALTRLFREKSRWFLWEGVTPTLGYTFGQTMYTPQNISEPGPQLFDRPWGALVFFGATAHATHRIGQRTDYRGTELKLGWTGSAALGRQVQSGVHKLTNSVPPLGWNQQLRARPAIQLTHARVSQIDDRGGSDLVGLQWGWGASLGTLRSYANLNLGIVVGRLGGDDSPLLIGNEGDFVAPDFQRRAQFGHWYGFLAANVTGVAYNYFLEGSTPYGKPRLQPKPAYWMIQWGISVPTHRMFGDSTARWIPRLVFTHTTRSAEFRRDDGGREALQRWGTLMLYWDLQP